MAAPIIVRPVQFSHIAPLTARAVRHESPVTAPGVPCEGRIRPAKKVGIALPGKSGAVDSHGGAQGLLSLQMWPGSCSCRIFMMRDLRPINVPCPQCTSHITECMEALSTRSMVNYLRCYTCGHVWALPRAASAEPCDFPPAAAGH